MEVSKSPPAVPTARAGTATATGQGSQSAAHIAPPANGADIRPLDISAALQILLAEVRAGFDLPANTAIAQQSAIPQSMIQHSLIQQSLIPQVAIMQSPAQAARDLVEVLLQALPENAGDAPAWTATLVRVEASMQSSIERAIAIVTQWRDVPAAVVAAVKDTRTLVFSALGDEPQNPLWLRPEWVGLAPSIRRFWRRRRNARRRLTDPDYSSGSLDEGEEFRR
jgi:hypothetical protein